MSYIGNVVTVIPSSLSGNLDVNGNKITSGSNGNIDIEPNGTGDVLLGNFRFDADQSVGSGQDNYVLTYDHSGGKIGLEVAASPYGNSNVDSHLNISSATSGKVLSWNGSDYAWVTDSGGIASLQADSSPQLGGNLDINGNDIVSTSNANIDLDPNGSGKVVFKGNSTKGSGQFVLNCENNSHGIIVKGPPHSASASYTLTLPNNDGNSGEYLSTDGSGNLGWGTPSGSSSASTADIFTIQTTSSAPSSVAQNTVKLYESSSALHIRSYRGNASYPGVVLVNSAGTEVVKMFTDGDIMSVKNVIGAKFIVEGGSASGRIEIQAPSTSDHISIGVPSTLSNGSTDYILPEDGSNGTFLKTNGSGTLSWSNTATFTGELTAEGGLNENHNAGTLSNSNQTLTLDCHTGNNFSVTTAANITSLVVSNLPASGIAFFFTLKVTFGGSHSISWPSAVKWNAGTAPTLSTSGTDVFSFYTVDSGTTIYGFTAGQALA